jgi:hypothetical protein
MGVSLFGTRFHRFIGKYGTINGQERGRLRAVEEDVVPVTFETLCLASELHAVVSESRHQTRRPVPITPTTLHSHNLSSTSGCQDNADGKATLMNGWACSMVENAAMRHQHGGVFPPVCPTIMDGAACPSPPPFRWSPKALISGRPPITGRPPWEARECCQERYGWRLKRRRLLIAMV